MSTTVTSRLHARAVRPAAPGRPWAVMRVPGNVLVDGWKDRAGVQHFRAEERELRRFVERQLLDEPRVFHDARIRGQHAVHVGPDLNLADVEARAEDRGRVIRSTTAERRRHTRRRRADEAAEHRDFPRSLQRRDGLAHAIARGRHVRRGRGVLRIRDEDAARVDPGARDPAIGQRGGHDAAAHEFADRQHGVLRSRRHFSQNRERVHEADQFVELRLHARDDARPARRGDRGRDGHVPLDQRRQRLRRAAGIAVLGEAADVHERVGHFRQRRDDDHRRFLA